MTEGQKFAELAFALSVPVNSTLPPTITLSKEQLAEMFDAALKLHDAMKGTNP